MRNKMQWDISRNLYIFIRENAFESVICEMSALLSRTQYVIFSQWSSLRWHQFVKYFLVEEKGSYILHHEHHGLYSLSRWTSNWKISKSIEAMRFGYRLFPIALKFDRILGSSAAEMPVNLQNFQNGTVNKTPNITASRLHEILRYDACPLSEQRPNNVHDLATQETMASAAMMY